nr:MAG TPA: hypothetical protein [Caudoviricetes sp.]DAX30000.1 MAG TPA: hypothetical protein [Caudoviricetes sp.]
MMVFTELEFIGFLISGPLGRSRTDFPQAA